MRGEVSILARCALFLASYAPLFALLVVLHWGDGWALVFLALTLAGVIGGLGVLWFIGRAWPESATVIEAENDMSALGGYFVGWLFPFIIFQPDDSSSVVTLAWFFIWLGLVYVRGNLLHLNPFLLLLGYRVWRVRCEIGGHEQTFTLASQAPTIDPGMSLEVSPVTTEIRFGR